MTQKFIHYGIPLLLLLALNLLCAHNTQAAHLIGGELTYECAGTNLYQINLNIYRDCNCTNCAELDNPAFLTIFDADNQIVENLQVPLGDVSEIQPNLDGLCLTTLPDVCVQRGSYTILTNLPSSPGGYTVVYQRCCRNNTIDNLENPGSQGSTYTTFIPESGNEDCINNAAVFNNYPPVIVCTGSPLIFDHSATDVDGDSLVYTICDLYLGADQNDPQPQVASEPPYDNLTWKSGYNFDDPMGGTPPLTINSTTGELVGYPDVPGQYVVGVCVTEYRNGVAINTSTRDFQFNVAPCVAVVADANIEGDGGSDLYVCKGSDIQIKGAVYSADAYEWFPATGLNDPYSLNPIAGNVQQTITYVLAAYNNVSQCEDYDTVTIHVLPPLNADAGDDQTVCPGQSVQLQASGGEKYLWIPATGLSNANIANPVATPTQTTTYTVQVSNADGTCAATDQITITVGGNLEVSVQNSTLEICIGNQAQLQATAEGAISFEWTPDTGLDNANIANPMASPSETTTYTVTATDGSCTGTAQVTVVVNPLPNANAGNDQTICNGETASLQASGGTSYQWQPTQTLDNATIANPNATPTETTEYTVLVTDQNGCQNSDYVVVFVNDASNAGTLPPAPDTTFICAGNTTNLQVINFNLAPNHAINYILHKKADEPLNSLILQNTEGVFSKESDNSLQHNKVYWVTAVAGAILPNGNVDLNYPCLNFSNPTPVVFLSPIIFVIDDYCDFAETGNFTIATRIKGGYPQFNNNALYTVAGDISIQVPFNETFTQIIPEDAPDIYQYFVTDDGMGCTAEVSKEFYCEKTPVELLRFEAQANPNGNLIQWSTATETNSKNFIVQHSTNGTTFENIATLQAAGNSLQTQQYEVLHPTTQAGTHYYQLLETDLNNQTKKVAVTTVLRTQQTENVAIQIANIQPIPADNYVQIALNNVLTNTNLDLKLYSITGALILEKTINQTQNGIITLPINNYLSGIYVLKITNGANSAFAKIVKK